MNVVEVSKKDSPIQIFTYIGIPVDSLQQCNNATLTLSDGQSLFLNATSDTLHHSQSNDTVKFVSIDKSLQNINDRICIKRQSVIEENQPKQFSSDTTFLKSEEKLMVKYSTANSGGSNSFNKDECSFFKCPQCDLVLEKLCLYRKHMEMHKNTKKYKCDQCSNSYNVEVNLKLHMSLHVKSRPTCPVCDKKFQRLASLKAHIIVHEVDETFTCIHCLSEFDLEDDYNNHMEKHNQRKVGSAVNNTLLECSICKHVFQNAEQRKEHISSHLKIKKSASNGKRQKRKPTANKQHKYQCEVCDKSFPKYCLLERHVRVHSGEKPFACHLCERAFAQKGTLQIHIMRHTGVRPFRCTLCSATFCQRGNLRVHIAKTHVIPAPGEKVFKCSMCTCVFKKVASLNAHTSKAHARERQCDDVSDIIVELKKLENHMQLKNCNQKQADLIQKNVTKETDGNSVKYVKLVDHSVEGNFRRFLVKKRGAGQHQWYICSFCSKEFKKPSDLIRHIRVHTREKPFKCKHCDQAFSLKSTLSHHMNTHTAKRHYQCIVCLKMFTSIKALKAHLRRHMHGKAKQINYYMCPKCNKVYNSVTKMKLHIKYHADNEEPVKTQPITEVIMQQPMMETANGLLPITPSTLSKTFTQEKPRPYKCQVCEASFTRTVHLRRHMAIHSGERKFNCEICKKWFCHSYAKDHMKIHIGEKTFECKDCGKKFRSNTVLKRHLTSHSYDRLYVCPYCRKHFKTILMCRKHINLHKEDLEVEQFRVKDGEIIANIHKSIPINESNQVFSLKSNKALQESKILFTDVEKGIIISTSIDTGTEDNNLLQENINQTEMCSAIIEKCETLPLLTDDPTQNILDPVEDTPVHSTNIDASDNGFPSVYVNSDDLQTLSSTNVYNACLSRLKTKDPLLVSGLNGIQDPNLLFSTDPTLTHITNSQLDSHNLETLIPTLNFSNSLSLNQSFPNIVLTNLDDNEVNQFPLFSNINEFNTKSQSNSKFIEVDNPKFIIDSNLIGLADNSSVGSTIISNLYSNASLNVVETKEQTNTVSFPLSSNTLSLICSYCKQSMKDSSDCKDHICTITTAESSENKITSVKFSTNKKKKRTKSKSNQPKKNYYKKFKEDVGTSGDAKEKYKCTLCDNVAPNKGTFTRHFLTHSVIKECTYCGKHFKKRSDLERHIRTHTGEKPYKCDKCEKRFSLKSTLDSHIRTHKPGGNKDFSCAVCNSCFSSKSSLRVHILMHTGVRPYQCSLCPEKFRTSGHRKSHMNSHSKQNGTKKVGQSKSAKIKLLDSVAMQASVVEENPSVEVTPLLDIKVLLVQGRYNSSDATHRVWTVMIFSKCVNKEMMLTLTIFRFRMDRESLQVLLEESVPSEAIEVDPIFLQQLQLNNILLQDNIDEELTSFIQVDVNNDGQITDVKSISNDLLSHLNNFDTQLENEVIASNVDINYDLDNKISKPKTFECNICNKKYSSKSVLTKHKKIHIRNSSFKCTKCDSQFSTGADLENHLKLHSGYRPFCCQLCANTFREEKNLKTHMRRIHGFV
ncbi:hypothetical protein FQA39_LY05860 [Lamprigera yunnana]|nr:hypothetical protein FQA39_LY05860 [Lamprigera yunnana]